MISFIENQPPSNQSKSCILDFLNCSSPMNLLIFVLICLKYKSFVLFLILLEYANTPLAEIKIKLLLYVSKYPLAGNWLAIPYNNMFF